MRREIIVTVIARVFFAMLIGASHLWAYESVRATDGIIGKSPVDDSMAKPVQWTMNAIEEPQDSRMGKSPMPFVLVGPPPEGKGPGLRFDTNKIFYVYTDNRGPQNHFAPSGWMGDYGDIRFNDASTTQPADGKTCIEITYNPRLSQGQGWAGIYWQEPRNNWGDANGGYNLAGMKRLTFWARGAQGGEYVASFKVGGIRGTKSDTGEAEIGPVFLTKEWRQYVIDLSQTNLSKISGGFAWATNATSSPQTFYIDEIRYER